MAARQLKTNRGLAKYFFLGLITFGIYDLIVMYHVSEEINLVAANDGKKTMNYLLLVLLLTPITLGIADLVWFSRLSGRIGDTLQARGIDYKFGKGTFWGWNIFGALILVGPFIFFHKFFKAMNKLNADYNERG